MINDMNDMTKSGLRRLAVDTSCSSFMYYSFMYYDFIKSQAYSANGPRCRNIYIYISIAYVRCVGFTNKKTVSSVFTSHMDR